MPTPRDSQRIVIAGASSLLGAELKSLLEESPFAGWDLSLVDEETAAERAKLDAAGDDVGLSLLIASQKLLMVAIGTPVRVLEIREDTSDCQVRILEGEHYGKTALVPLKATGLL